MTANISPPLPAVWRCPVPPEPGRVDAPTSPPCDCPACGHGTHHERDCMWFAAYQLGQLPSRDTDDPAQAGEQS